MKKSKEPFEEICKIMAMLMVIKEQSEIQGSISKPAKNIYINEKEMVSRFNYFFQHLFQRLKTVEQLELEFRARRI